MLSEDNIEKINDLIESELRTVDRSFVSHEEKLQALERVSKLKALLYPQPSTEEIVEKLAASLARQTTATAQPSPMDRIFDHFFHGTKPE